MRRSTIRSLEPVSRTTSKRASSLLTASIGSRESIRFEFGTDDRHLPLLTDRADKVVNGITSLVTVMDSVDGTGSFLSVPASNAPPSV